MQDLIDAIYRNDLSAIRALIPTYGEQLNAPGTDTESGFRGTLLMHAVRAGDIGVVQFLLELRDENNHRLINQNAVSGNRTALDLVEHGRTQLFDLLKKHHAVTNFGLNHNSSENPTVDGCNTASLARLKTRYGEIDVDEICETFRHEVSDYVQMPVTYLIDKLGHARYPYANNMTGRECLAYLVTAAKDPNTRTAEQVDMDADAVVQKRLAALILALTSAWTAYGIRSACTHGFITQTGASLHMVHPDVITAADPEEAMCAINRSIEDVVTALFCQQSFHQQLALLQALAEEDHNAPAVLDFYAVATPEITKALEGFPDHILPPEHYDRYLAEKYTIQFRLAVVATLDFIATLGRRIAHQNHEFDTRIIFTPGPECTNLQEQVSYLQQALIIPSVQEIRRTAGGITGPLFNGLAESVQNEIVQSLLANNKTPILPGGKIDEPWLLQLLMPHLAEADFTVCCDSISRGNTLTALLFRGRNPKQKFNILKSLLPGSSGSKDILNTEGAVNERQLLRAMEPTLTSLELVEVIKSRQQESAFVAVFAGLPQASQVDIIEMMNLNDHTIILDSGNLNELELLPRTLTHLTPSQLNTLLDDEECADQLRANIASHDFDWLQYYLVHFPESSKQHFLNAALERNLISLDNNLSYSRIFLMLDNTDQLPVRAQLWDILFAKLQAPRAYNANRFFLPRTHRFDELRPLFPSVAATTLAEFVQHTPVDAPHGLNDGLAYLYRNLRPGDFDKVLLALGAPYFSVETPNNWFEMLTTLDSLACKDLLTRLHKLELLPPWFSNLQTMIARLQPLPRTRITVINFILENLPFAASIAQLETTASLVFILNNTPGNNTRLLEQVTPELLESIVKCSDDLTLLIEAANGKDLFDLICKIKPEKLKEICSLRQLGDILYKIGNIRTSSLVDNKEHKVIFNRIYSPAMGTKAPSELLPLLSTTIDQSIYDVIHRQLTTEINNAASVANLLSNRAANLKNSPYLAINSQGKRIVGAILTNVFPDVDALLQGLRQTDFPGENNPILGEVVTTQVRNRLLANVDDIIKVLSRPGVKDNDFTLMLEHGIFNTAINTDADLRKLIAFVARRMANYEEYLEPLYQRLNLRKIIPSFEQLKVFQISLNDEFHPDTEAQYRDSSFLLRLPQATLKNYLTTPEQKAELLTLAHNPATLDAHLTSVSGTEGNVFYQFMECCCQSTQKHEYLASYIVILQYVKETIIDLRGSLADNSSELRRRLEGLRGRTDDSVGREGRRYKPCFWETFSKKSRFSYCFEEIINLSWNEINEQFDAFQRAVEQPRFKATVDVDIYSKLLGVFPTMEAPLETYRHCQS